MTTLDEARFFNESEKAYHARCPFCGKTLMMGVRADNGNIALVHQVNVGDLGVVTAGCERFSKLSVQADVIRQLASLGVRWQTYVFP